MEFMTAAAISPASPSRPDARQAARLDALRRFVAEHQRPPRRHAISTRERSLAEWMVHASGQRATAMAIRAIITGQDRAATRPAAPSPEPLAEPTPRPAAELSEPKRTRSSSSGRTKPPKDAVWLPTAWVDKHAPSGPPEWMEQKADTATTPIQRLRALQRFMDTFHRIPRPDAAEPEERELAVWMRAERRAGNKFVAVAIASRGLNSK